MNEEDVVIDPQNNVAYWHNRAIKLGGEVDGLASLADSLATRLAAEQRDCAEWRDTACRRAYEAGMAERKLKEAEGLQRELDALVSKELNETRRERDEWQRLAISADGLLMEVFDCCEPDKVRLAARLMNESIDEARRERDECRAALEVANRCADEHLRVRHKLRQALVDIVDAVARRYDPWSNPQASYGDRLCEVSSVAAAALRAESGEGGKAE